MIYKNLTFVKKTVFIALSICCAVNVNAQIKVQNNNVLVGPLYYTPNYPLEVKEKTYFGCLPATSGFFFDTTIKNSQVIPSIVPQWQNTARIGSPLRPLYEIHTKSISTYQNIVISDINTKENIRPMDRTLERINQLELIKYDYKTDFFCGTEKTEEQLKDDIERMRTNNSGFIAQNMIKYYPDLVVYDKDMDLYGINYLGMIPELTKAVQELSTKVDSLESVIKALTDNGSFELKNKKITNKALLYQNTPNPFFENTQIKCYLLDDIQTASVHVYNLNGEEKSVYPVTSRGYCEITINGKDLNAGMYIYTLIADGNVIDSKKMILTK